MTPEQAPAFKCKKKDSLHNAEVGDIIKMSAKSLKEFDEEFPRWRDKYVELTLKEEMDALK